MLVLMLVVLLQLLDLYSLMLVLVVLLMISILYYNHFFFRKHNIQFILDCFHNNTLMGNSFL